MASLKSSENKYQNKLLKKLNKVSQITESLMTKIRLRHDMDEADFNVGTVMIETVQTELKNLDDFYSGTHDGGDSLSNVEIKTEPSSETVEIPRLHSYTEAGCSNKKGNNISREVRTDRTDTASESPNSDADYSPDTPEKLIVQRGAGKELSENVETAEEQSNEYDGDTDTENQSDTDVIEPTPQKPPIARNFATPGGVVLTKQELEETDEIMNYYVAHDDDDDEFDDAMLQEVDAACAKATAAEGSQSATEDDRTKEDELDSSAPPVDPKFVEALKTHFGHSKFRPNQGTKSTESQTSRVHAVEMARPSAGTETISAVKGSALSSSQENEHTMKKTRRECAFFINWLQTQFREFRPIQDIPPCELDPILAMFYTTVKKRDGSEYEPDSITSYHKSIARYLRTTNYGISVNEDERFMNSRRALAAKRKQLKESGKGNALKKVKVFSSDHVATLVRAGQLGIHSPTAILNTVFLNNTKLFGLRGCMEHKKLMWGDIILASDEKGEYLIYEGQPTKIGNCVGNVCVKAYATPSNLATCPVHVYKAYSARRPSDMNHKDAPFYLMLEHVASMVNKGTWFRKKAVGINKLYTVLRTLGTAVDYYI